MKFGFLKILCLTAAIAATSPANAREKLFADDQTLGNPNAPVVMVEYFAPMCPYCAKFAADPFPQIKREYIDTGKVLYVLRLFPLGAPDGAVSGMAKCLGPGRYYEFIDLAFQKQELWDPDGHTIADIPGALVQLGGLAGLKPDDAKRCMLDKDEYERINRIAEDGQNRYHIEGVPTLILDGKAVPVEEMAWPALKTRVDARLAEIATTPKTKAPVAKASKHHRHHVHHRHHKHRLHKVKARKA